MLPRSQPARPSRPPRVACIGLASWDRLLVVDRYPDAGHYEIVRAEGEGPGGTTTNSAVALARLGASVFVRAQLGHDAQGAAMLSALEREGIDTVGLTIVPGASTDSATIIVSRNPPDRTIYWHQGARLVRGDRIDIPHLFGHDVVLLDVDDVPLRRFLLDLPAHTLPATRLLGSLTYLDNAAIPDALNLVMRHDAIVGNQRELIAITGAHDFDGAVSAVRARMPGENLRAAAISRGPDGATAFTVSERWDCPAFAVPVIDTTGAGDAFAGAVTFGVACRWEWPDVLLLANAVAGLSTTAIGAQTSLPNWDAVTHLLESS